MARQDKLKRIINHHNQVKENKAKEKQNHEDMVRNAHKEKNI